MYIWNVSRTLVVSFTAHSEKDVVRSFFNSPHAGPARQWQTGPHRLRQPPPIASSPTRCLKEALTQAADIYQGEEGKDLVSQSLQGKSEARDPENHVAHVAHAAHSAWPNGDGRITVSCEISPGACSLTGSCARRVKRPGR